MIYNKLKTEEVPGVINNYEFDTSGGIFKVKMPTHINWYLTDINDKPAYDIFTNLEITDFNGLSPLELTYYIKAGHYKMCINDTQNVYMQFSYTVNIDTSDNNNRLIDEAVIDSTTTIANPLYPPNGRLMTQEDLFAEYHDDNNEFFIQGYYLMDETKDKLVTFEELQNGINIKILTRLGYNFLINRLPEEYYDDEYYIENNGFQTNKDSRYFYNPAYLYRINPDLPSDKQVVPDDYKQHILNAIIEWGSRNAPNKLDEINHITLDTNLFNIISLTITNNSKVLTEELINNILNEIKTNNITPQHRELYEKIIGYEAGYTGRYDKQGSSKYTGSLIDLIWFITNSYKVNIGPTGVDELYLLESTLFPNNLGDYTYKSLEYKPNTMLFLNGPGIWGQYGLQHLFVGQGEKYKEPGSVNYDVPMYAMPYKISINLDNTFTISHSYSYDINNQKENLLAFNAHFYNSDGSNYLTISKLIDLMYVPIWYKIVNELVYNTINISASAINGSLIYYYNDNNLSTITKYKKVVRICDVINILFKYYPITTPKYPWYLMRYLTNSTLKQYVNKSETQLMPNNALKTEYEYYNMHTYDPNWKKLRGINTLLAGYEYHDLNYVININNQATSIKIPDPSIYIADPSGTGIASEYLHNNSNKFTYDNNINTGIYGARNIENHPSMHEIMPWDRGDNDPNLPINPRPIDPEPTPTPNPTGPTDGTGGGRINSDPDEEKSDGNITDIIDITKYDNTINSYFALLPSSQNLTPLILQTLVFLSLGKDHSGLNTLVSNIRKIDMIQYPRLYGLLFVLYKSSPSNNSVTASTVLTPDSFKVSETTSNFGIKLIGKGKLDTTKISDTDACFKLFSILYANDLSKHDMNFIINLSTSIDITTVAYKIGIYIFDIDSKNNIELFDNIDMRYIYDPKKYITFTDTSTGDNILKAERADLFGNDPKFKKLVDPNLLITGGLNEYNKISIDCKLPDDTNGISVNTLLWSTEKTSNNNNSFKVNFTFKTTQDINYN